MVIIYILTFPLLTHTYSLSLYLFTLSFCMFTFPCLCKQSQAGLVMKPHPLFVCLFVYFFIEYSIEFTSRASVTSEMTLNANESECA